MRRPGVVGARPLVAPGGADAGRPCHVGRMWCFLAAALAADPASVFVDPHDLRIVRLPGVGAAGTPGGDSTPEVGAGLFLTIVGAKAGAAGVEELRASVDPADARTLAGLVASAEPLAATLAREEADFAATVGSPDAPQCHRARVERYTLTLIATGTALKGQRAVPGSETKTDGACPR